MARKQISAESIIDQKIENEHNHNPEVDARMVALHKEVDSKLDEAKGKFTAIAVVGVTEDGSFDLLTNVSQYSYLQWLLNKGSFELFIHEKNAGVEKKAA